MNKQFLPLLLLLVSLSATAQFRTVPDSAKRGIMTHVREMQVVIDGKQLVLAPGAQIRSHNNLIIVPSQLSPESLVKYQLDADGMVMRAWILSADEAARPDKPPQSQ
jgi:hypothetical protein